MNNAYWILSSFCFSLNPLISLLGSVYDLLSLGRNSGQRGGPFDLTQQLLREHPGFELQIWPILFVILFWAAGPASVTKEGSRSSQRPTEAISLQGPPGYTFLTCSHGMVSFQVP